jgi:hypothetical protein
LQASDEHDLTGVMIENKVAMCVYIIPRKESPSPQRNLSKHAHHSEFPSLKKLALRLIEDTKMESIVSRQFVHQAHKLDAAVADRAAHEYMDLMQGRIPGRTPLGWYTGIIAKVFQG